MNIRILLSLLLAVLVSATTPDTFAQQLLYIHADHLNTPRLVTNGSGTPVWRWDQTEPFGDNLPNEDPDGNGTPGHMPLRFPGQYFDKETNLHYNMARDYDPGTGRYVQADPIGSVLFPDIVADMIAGRDLPQPEGLQLYSLFPKYNHTYNYVANDPLIRIDPSGLLGEEAGFSGPDGFNSGDGAGGDIVCSSRGGCYKVCRMMYGPVFAACRFIMRRYPHVGLQCYLAAQIGLAACIDRCNKKPRRKL